jgi:hypothetical protein
MIKTTYAYNLFTLLQKYQDLVLLMSILRV